MCFHSLLGELTPRTSANPGIDFLPLWDCLALWSEFDLDRCGHSLAMELLRRLAFRCYSCKLRPLLPHLSLPDSRRTSTKFTSFDNGDDFLPEFLAQEPPMHRLLICSRELEARTLHGSWNLTCDYAADFDWLRRESGRTRLSTSCLTCITHWPPRWSSSESGSPVFSSTPVLETLTLLKDPDFRLWQEHVGAWDCPQLALVCIGFTTLRDRILTGNLSTFLCEILGFGATLRLPRLVFRT